MSTYGVYVEFSLHYDNINGSQNEFFDFECRGKNWCTVFPDLHFLLVSSILV